MDLKTVRFPYKKGKIESCLENKSEWQNATCPSPIKLKNAPRLT